MVDVPVLRAPRGRPLRLAHLTTVGLSQATLLAVELRVDVVTGIETMAISAPDEYVPRVEALGVCHVPVNALTRAWSPAEDAKAARELGRLLRELDLDVLHTHNPKTGVLGRLFGRAARIPVVVNTCHGLWAQAHDTMRRRAFVLSMEGLAAQASHAELYQNAEDRAALARWVPAWRSRVVGNGTDLSAFGPDPEARARVRAEWGVSDEEVLVGGVGRLVAEKGIAEFGSAAQALGGRARFVWVGPGDPDKPDAWTREVEGVELVGARDDMPAIYNAFDIFVLPSYREGFSRSAMEAAVTGLPLVLSDIRGCREVGRDQQEALLVPAGDARALTSALEKLLDNPARETALGAAARSRALAEFDQVAVAAISLETYAAIARRRGLGWSMERRSWKNWWEPLVPSQGYARTKRTADVVAAAAGLLVTAPILAATAVAVRRSMGSPVLFRQERSGKDGVPFAVLKFRTMRDLVQGENLFTSDDTRLTPLGRRLRGLSVDELPQLLNVLRGEMSLVGPRPLPTVYLGRYSARQRRRLEVAPGITGWAQVNGRNAVGWSERFELDVWYVEHASFALDLHILLRTVGQVFAGKGVSAADHVTMPEFLGDPTQHPASSA